MLYTPRARGEPLVAAGHFQRCPKPEENQVPVLRGARHVQEWLSPTRQVQPAALGTRPEEVTRTSLCGLAELPGAATPSRVPEDSHALASGKGIRTFFFSLRLLLFRPRSVGLTTALSRGREGGRGGSRIRACLHPYRSKHPDC